MTEEFDPYSEWLGIGAHERPVDHYRLLGIGRLTADPAAIAVAADRRMALIRSYQTGPRGRFTQQLLNEIAAAKISLLNPSAKMAYDSMLEGLAAATEPPPLAASSPQPALPPPPLFQLDSRDLGDADGDQDAEAMDLDEPGGLSVGSIVLALALLVIVVVGATVTWQIMLHRRRSQAINPYLVADDGKQGGGADAGDGPFPPDEPVLVFQETDGSVNFTPSVAILLGDALHMETLDVTNLLVGWTSLDDAAVWKFKLIKLPPNGVFRVLVTYRATPEANEGSFTISIDGRDKTCQIRGTGEFVTDEYFLAVTRPGEHSMELGSPELSGGTFEVKGVRLLMPRREEE